MFNDKNIYEEKYKRLIRNVLDIGKKNGSHPYLIMEQIDKDIIDDIRQVQLDKRSATRIMGRKNDMTTFTIKGLYIGRYEERKNPTYYGTLKGAMKYADTSNFIHYGEDIKVCVGETVMAIQKWNKKVDEAGEYYESEKWEIKRC